MKADLSTDILAEQLGHETADMAQSLGFGSFAPALKECVDIAHKSIGENFAAEAAPHGGAWAPRKVAGDDHPLLIDTTKMFTASTNDFGEGAVNEIGDREASTGVDPGEVPYAAAQNFGYAENNLPQREFEDVSEAAMDEMTEVMADRGVELLMGHGQGEKWH